MYSVNCFISFYYSSDIKVLATLLSPLLNTSNIKKLYVKFSFVYIYRISFSSYFVILKYYVYMYILTDLYILSI